MANHESVEPLLKKVKTEKELLLFTGKKLCCLYQLLPNRSWCGFLYSGYWRDNEQEKEVVVRRIQKIDCRENWENILNRHLANSLNHENVLNIIGYEDDINRWRYFALEWFDATLEQYCNGEYTGPMPCKANTLCQISDGLNYLHDKGLAHGQLNPSSILIVQAESVVIKISDFLCGTLKASENVDCLLHPKYWMLPNSRPTASKIQGVQKITFTFTVYGDVFAAGCLFFYYLSRGLHPFGNEKAILENISKYRPVNLKKLDRNHFAYQSIKDMLGEPPQDGTQYLRIAAAHFKDVPRYQFKEILRSVADINGQLVVRFHPALPVLACFICDRVTLFSASKGSVPFINWKECEVKIEGQHLQKITALQWNQNGDFVAAGFEDGCVAVWRYPTGEIVFKVTQHLEKVIAIYWSPSKHELFATYDDDGYQMLLWNSSPSNHQKTLFYTIESDGIIVHVVWTSNQQIIVGCENGTITIYQINGAESSLLKTFKEKGTIFSLFWDEASQYFSSVTVDNLNIWSLDSDEVILSSKIDSTWCCLALISNRKPGDRFDAARRSMSNFKCVCGLSNGSIVIWNPFEESKIPLILEKHSALVISFLFSHDGKFLASTSKNEIIIWSTKSWTPVFQRESNDCNGFSWLTSVSNAEPAYKLAVSSRCNIIRIIEIADTEYDMYNEN